MSPRGVVVALLLGRNERALDLAHLGFAGELRHVDGAERALADRLHALEDGLFATLPEILERMPGGVDGERRDEPDIQIEAQAERLIFGKRRPRMRAAIDRHDRRRHPRTRLADLLWCLQ